MKIILNFYKLSNELKVYMIEELKLRIIYFHITKTKKQIILKCNLLKVYSRNDLVK